MGRNNGEGMERPNGEALDRQEEIFAFCEGDMTPEETRRFEARMDADEGLRREVEEWREALGAAREWADGEAPGTERVKGLAIPLLAEGRSDEPVQAARRRADRVVLRVRILQALAVAAIFLMGFALGHVARQPGHEVATATQPARPAQVATPIPDEASRAPSVVPTSRPKSPKVAEAVPGAAASGRYTHDENGRLTVETTLKESGGRALWVVDGSFQLAQNASQE